MANTFLFSESLLTRRVFRKTYGETKALSSAGCTVLYQSSVLGTYKQLLSFFLTAKLAESVLKWFLMITCTWEKLSVQLPAIHKLEHTKLLIIIKY